MDQTKGTGSHGGSACDSRSVAVKPRTLKEKVTVQKMLKAASLEHIPKNMDTQRVVLDVRENVASEIGQRTQRGRRGNIPVPSQILRYITRHRFRVRADVTHVQTAGVTTSEATQTNTRGKR